jgi:hypothetical protein
MQNVDAVETITVEGRSYSTMKALADKHGTQTVRVCQLVKGASVPVIQIKGTRTLLVDVEIFEETKKKVRPYRQQSLNAAAA